MATIPSIWSREDPVRWRKSPHQSLWSGSFSLSNCAERIDPRHSYLPRSNGWWHSMASAYYPKLACFKTKKNSNQIFLNQGTKNQSFYLTMYRKSLATIFVVVQLIKQRIIKNITKYSDQTNVFRLNLIIAVWVYRTWFDQHERWILKNTFSITNTRIETNCMRELATVEKSK